MEILELHGQRFEVALKLLHECKSFILEGVQFSLMPDGLLVVAVESSYWPPDNMTEQTALSDLQRAKSVADYLAQENSSFAVIYRKRQCLFILLNYYGHGGETEAARLVDGQVVWAKRMPQALRAI